MGSFKDALLDSTIIQGTVTLALVGSVIYLSVVGAAVPEVLVNSLMIVIGFWFGSKVTQAVRASGNK
jgi:hypothetical protein